jgi:hypothetical protein
MCITDHLSITRGDAPQGRDPRRIRLRLIANPRIEIGTRLRNISNGVTLHVCAA